MPMPTATPIPPGDGSASGIKPRKATKAAKKAPTKKTTKSPARKPAKKAAPKATQKPAKRTTKTTRSPARPASQRSTAMVVKSASAIRAEAKKNAKSTTSNPLRQAAEFIDALNEDDVTPSERVAILAAVPDEVKPYMPEIFTLGEDGKWITAGINATAPGTPPAASATARDTPAGKVVATGDKYLLVVPAVPTEATYVNVYDKLTDGWSTAPQFNIASEAEFNQHKAALTKKEKEGKTPAQIVDLAVDRFAHGKPLPSSDRKWYQKAGRYILTGSTD